ncbi:MAG: nicotinate-nucleotide--dimethylbenzimidazole phosphoribosyltransferase [Ignavibacteriaceae bacterium]
MKFNISKVSEELKEDILQKINNKTKPPGSLGKLETLALKICLIQNTLIPELNNPAIVVFAGDHGICSAGVSAYPPEVTYQMVLNFLNGGAAINVFCRQNNIKIKVVDVGVNFDFPPDTDLINAKVGYGTNNFLEQHAMSPDECENAILKGAEIVQAINNDGSNIIGFGEMGIGNTSSASVIMSKLLDLPLQDCAGRGTGLDNDGLNHKIDILKQAVVNHNNIEKSSLQVLSTFGGFEIAAIFGAILKAAELKMIIIIDGFIVTSALLAAYKYNSHVLDYCIFAHTSDEKGHKLMLDKLNAEPLLDLGMRLGEGTGAAVSYPVISAAVNFLNQMASFDSAGVAKKG